MDTITVKEMKREFNERLNNLLMSKSHNAQLYTKAAYFDLIEKVKEAQHIQNNKRPEHYQRLKRFEVVKMADGTEKLILPGTVQSRIRFYVHTEEIFDILHKAHTVNTKHGGRNRMDNFLNQNYKNITREVIIMYLNLCSVCGKQYTTPTSKKNLQIDNQVVVNPTLMKDTSTRCHIDLIDMRLRADQKWKFILIYRDDRTKFVQLRPLKTNTAEEVAHVLLDIFAIIGAPCILQTGINREFAKEVIEELSSMWSVLKMVYGKNNSRKVSINQEIQNLLNNWMMANNTYKWSEGLRFVQMTKNKTHDIDINCSPFEAMFGARMTIGLKTLLPRTVLVGVESEEDLISRMRCQESTQCKNPITDEHYDTLVMPGPSGVSDS